MLDMPLRWETPLSMAALIFFCNSSSWEETRKGANKHKAKVNHPNRAGDNMDRPPVDKQKMASSNDLPEAILLDGRLYYQSLFPWPFTMPSLGVAAWAQVWKEMLPFTMRTLPSNRLTLMPE